VDGLTTERLRLRPLRPEDADALYEIYSHPLVEAWIGPHTRERAAEEIAYQVEGQAERGYSVWAVEDRRDGRFVGDCGLQPLEHKGPEVELGYDLHPDVWGQGLATEAAGAVVEAGLGPLGLERLVAVVKPANSASRRVLAKAGLREAGRRGAYGELMVLYETGPAQP
jgi:[ribosomal protein S5]-alanine N-acetyltransferase